MATPKQRVEKIQKEVSGVESQYGLTSWEKNFLKDIRDRTVLTDRQHKALVEIEAKVFETEDEDDGTEEGVQRADDRFNRGKR